MSLERTVEWNGEVRTVTDWAVITGIPFKILIARFNSKWETGNALTKPVRAWKKGGRTGAKEEPEYEKDDGKGHKDCFMDTEYGDQGGIL